MQYRFIGKLLLMASLVFSLNGCSAVDSTRTVWPLATASPEDTVTHLFAEKFAEEASRLSDGAICIEVYPSSTLGSDRELLESCADGDIPFVVQNTSPQVSFMEDLAVFDCPCVFSSIESLRKALDNPEFLLQIEEVYQKGGYSLLGMADQGFRVMSTNKPVDSLEDFKGQKIRTMENPYHLRFWQSVGASPTPMSFSEVYIGLQQHTLDAQENPYEVIVSNRLFEQQDYIVETNHLPHLITLIAADGFIHRCTPKQQAILKEAAANAVQYAREQSDLRIEQRRKIIEESGTKILRLDEQTLSSLQQAAAPVKEAIEQSVDPALIEAWLSSTS